MLARRGIFSTVTVQLVEMYFDTTRYSTGILPAGRYQALRIDLGGNARHGKNWWCVLYPPLCFTSGTQDVVYRSLIYDIIEKFFKG